MPRAGTGPGGQALLLAGALGQALGTGPALTAPWGSPQPPAHLVH